MRMRERSYIHVHQQIWRHAVHGLLSLNHPPKIPTYEASTYQKGSSLIDARLFRPNLFLQSFTVHALLVRKNVFHGFENSTVCSLLQLQFWPAFVAVSECTSVTTAQPLLNSSLVLLLRPRERLPRCFVEVNFTPSTPTTVLATTRRDVCKT